jgi:hypothetical protein
MREMVASVAGGLEYDKTHSEEALEVTFSDGETVKDL